MNVKYCNMNEGIRRRSSGPVSAQPYFFFLPLLNTALTEPATRKAPSGPREAGGQAPPSVPAQRDIRGHGAVPARDPDETTQTQTAQPCSRGKVRPDAIEAGKTRGMAQRRAHPSTVTRAHRHSLCEDAQEHMTRSRQPEASCRCQAAHQAGADPASPSGGLMPHGPGHAASRGRPPRERLMHRHAAARLPAPALGPGLEHSPPAPGGGQEPAALRVTDQLGSSLHSALWKGDREATSAVGGWARPRPRPRLSPVPLPAPSGARTPYTEGNNTLAPTSKVLQTTQTHHAKSNPSRPPCSSRPRASPLTLLPGELSTGPHPIPH